ncbi:Spermatogenesis- and oogenesis-specific basic helix-loop-helix-containing protein [Trichinella spiralis]|uniref:Spermatogenesis- and oogenesis-specific basic helix-loop-helix-containing protein n=1 Tax=Trichinella spiralis TaxID=6334 RepID=A0ABR3KGW4_TRISP
MGKIGDFNDTFALDISKKEASQKIGIVTFVLNLLSLIALGLDKNVGCHNKFVFLRYLCFVYCLFGIGLVVISSEKLQHFDMAIFVQRWTDALRSSHRLIIKLREPGGAVWSPFQACTTLGEDNSAHLHYQLKEKLLITLILCVLSYILTIVLSIIVINIAYTYYNFTDAVRIAQISNSNLEHHHQLEDFTNAQN